MWFWPTVPTEPSSTGGTYHQVNVHSLRHAWRVAHIAVNGAARTAALLRVCLHQRSHQVWICFSLEAAEL